MTARADWLERRRTGIGASDVAAILGMSPWGSPMSVWLDKTHGSSTFDGNTSTRLGLLAEEGVAAEFEHQTGLHVVDPQREIVDATRPWRRATLDGLVTDHPATNIDLDLALGVYEAKTHHGFGSWADDGIPDHYRLQLEWQMGVACLPAAWLAVWHWRPGTGDWVSTNLEIIEYRPEPGVWELLQTEIDRFWHDHVLTGRPPAGDGNKRTTAALQAMWSDTTAETVELTGDALDALDQLPAAKEASKLAAERVAALEQTVKAAMGEHETATVDGEITATWRPVAEFDHAAATAAHPRLAARYARPIQIDRDRLKRAWPTAAKYLTDRYTTRGARRLHIKKRTTK